jgi:uncharacterized tellurite resistance protein B-like protein
MGWKIDYLANLMRLIDRDSCESNRELLALIEIEQRIKAKIEEYIDAKIDSHTSEGAETIENPILARGLLKHLFLVAYIDNEMSQAEERMIRRYVAACEIEENVVENCRLEALKEAKRLVGDSLERQFGDL